MARIEGGGNQFQRSERGEVYSAPNAKGQACAVHLSEPSSSVDTDPVTWELSLFAHSKRERSLVGTWNPTRRDQPGFVAHSRVVAVAHVPGAEWYSVQWRPMESGARQSHANLWLELGDYVPSGPGLSFPLERWTYLRAVDGNIAVPRGFRVWRIGAHTVQANATLQVVTPAASLGLIGVPAPGDVAVEPLGRLHGPVTVSGVNTDGVLVELLTNG